MKTTQQRHANRIQRVIDHIHHHSANDIDSAAVAEVAQLSTYHWHRIYVAVTGESAVATLRRVRLQRCATALLRDDRPVAEIASDCGFDNLQAFTRLFSRTYGLPPGKFRSSGASSGVNREEQHPVSVASQTSRSNATPSVSTSVTAASGAASHVMDGQSSANVVDIARRAPLRLVGLRHQGDYHDIGRVFEKVMAAAEIESWPRSEAFTVGVYFDDPDVVPMDSCRSFAGVPVPESVKTPDGYESQQVPGGLHASCLHTGPYALLPDSYRWLYREWLRGAMQEARDDPCYEVYLNTPYNTPPAELQTLICMPLAG